MPCLASSNEAAGSKSACNTGAGAGLLHSRPGGAWLASRRPADGRTRSCSLLSRITNGMRPPHTKRPREGGLGQSCDAKAGLPAQSAGRVGRIFRSQQRDRGRRGVGGGEGWGGDTSRRPGGFSVVQDLVGRRDVFRAGRSRSVMKARWALVERLRPQSSAGFSPAGATGSFGFEFAWTLWWCSCSSKRHEGGRAPRISGTSAKYAQIFSLLSPPVPPCQAICRSKVVPWWQKGRDKKKIFRGCAHIARDPGGLLRIAKAAYGQSSAYLLCGSASRVGARDCDLTHSVRSTSPFFQRVICKPHTRYAQKTRGINRFRCTPERVEPGGEHIKRSRRGWFEVCVRSAPWDGGRERGVGSAWLPRRSCLDVGSICLSAAWHNHVEKGGATPLRSHWWSSREGASCCGTAMAIPSRADAGTRWWPRPPSQSPL